MITYTYIVRCPECEDEFFDFFDEAKDFAMGCLTKKPIITQTEVQRNDFGECTDHCDLGTVWSWEDMMRKETAAEPATSVFTKDDLKCMSDGKDPEFDNIDNSVDFEISEGLGDFDDFDIGPQSDELIPPEFEDAFEDPIEPVEEAISKVQADYLSRRKPMTKEEFAERLEAEDEILIFTGDPREAGIRGRDYFAAKVDGKYEVSFWDETYEDEFTDSEVAETFDTIDELWAYMVDFMEDDDFNPEYNYLAEGCAKKPINEDTEERLASNAKGDYVVRASSGHGYTVFNRSDVAIGGFSGDDDDKAIQRFKVGNIKEAREPIPEGMTIEQLQEEMEDNEDTVECSKCGNLVEKANCHHNKEGFGWCCNTCEPADTLVEAQEEYELAAIVKDSINHLTNDIGKDPWAKDFADDVIADIENNYDVEVPEDLAKYNSWANSIASEVSRQVNNPIDEEVEPEELHDLGNTYDGGYPEDAFDIEFPEV